MSVWVIIPIKPLNRSKSRLAEVLSPEQRQHFAENMLRHVIGVVRTVPAVAGTLVISRDTRALAIARDYGAHTVQESGPQELNSAITRAAQVVASWRGEAVLVLPADLPLIAAEDVEAIIAKGQFEPSIVIASDLVQDGTNALLMRPPGLFTFMYGEGSYQRHTQAAREAGARIESYFSERIALDMDTSDDLERYNHILQERNEKSLLSMMMDKST